MNEHKQAIITTLTSIMKDTTNAADDRLAAARELALMTGSYPEPKPAVEQRIARLINTAGVVLSEYHPMVAGNGDAREECAHALAHALHDLGYEP